jgi:hypothetical protein
VTPGSSGYGFLIDFGRWTNNPSYAYAGCQTSRPIPTVPCPIDSVATDAGHARRWPWWIESLDAAFAPGTAESEAIRSNRGRLASQFANVVLYRDPRGRPLMRNYMDGRDGWYRLREFPNHPWGLGPSTMSGVLRYGSWWPLSDEQPALADMGRAFCAVIVSRDPNDIEFRTRYYGSESTRPEMGGEGETDLYGSGSLYSLICRINAAMGVI